MMNIINKLSAKQKDLQGAHPITIAFLGDSVTQGCFECYQTGVNSLETVFDVKCAYSTHVREILAILYPNVQVNIINSGISGDSTLGGVARIERDILCYNPDLVIVSYGLNDSTAGEGALEDYAKRLEEIFRKIQAIGAECIFLTENMMNTDISVHFCNDKFFSNVSKGFADVQNSGTLDKYFDKAKEVAEKCGVKVCDCYAKWKAMYAGGVNITEMLANKINHPIRELTYIFAYSLIECMFMQ